MQRLMLVPALFSNTGQDTPNQFYCWECIVCLRDIDNLLPGWGISYHREAVWNNDTGPKPNNNIVVERDTGRRRNHNGWVSDSQSCWCLLPQPEQNRIQDPLELNHITTQTVWRPFFFFLSDHYQPDSATQVHWERQAPNKEADFSDWSAMRLHSPKTPSSHTNTHQNR